MINPAVDGLAEHVGTAAACALLGRSRASHYRAKNPPGVKSYWLGFRVLRELD